jgi:hypothetical protein
VVLALEADEAGALGVAVLLQPVGEDQADGGVVRLGLDGPDEPFAVVHDAASRMAGGTGAAAVLPFAPAHDPLHGERLATPRTLAPEGYRQPGNQCSTTTRPSRTAQRSTRSSLK